MAIFDRTGHDDNEPDADEEELFALATADEEETDDDYSLTGMRAKGGENVADGDSLTSPGSDDDGADSASDTAPAQSSPSDDGDADAAASRDGHAPSGLDAVARRRGRSGRNPLKALRRSGNADSADADASTAESVNVPGDANPSDKAAADDAIAATESRGKPDPAETKRAPKSKTAKPAKSRGHRQRTKDGGKGLFGGLGGGKSRSKKDGGDAKEGKNPFSSKGGKVRMSIPYPKSSLDMAANLLPPKLAKRREATASVKRGIMAAFALVALLAVLVFGLRLSHLLDGSGLPFVDGTPTTSQTVAPSTATKNGTATNGTARTPSSTSGTTSNTQNGAK